MREPRLQTKPVEPCHIYNVRISPALWRRFRETCQKEDRACSRVLLRFIERYVASGGEVHQ